jgi:FixJ family two-component response regulator
MDLRIADVDGIELYDLLCSSGRAVPAVFITGFGDIRTGVRAMKAGAVDFLQKPVDADALLAAVARALERDAVAAPARAERVQLERRLATLTPGEREVLRLLVAGLPNKQIAAALGTKERTVKTRRGSVLKKMHADSLADVVRMGLDLGLDGDDGQGTPGSK